MAIEIVDVKGKKIFHIQSAIIPTVDVPIKNGDFPKLLLVYQRV